MTGPITAQSGSNRLTEAIKGYTEPRIHSPVLDLPSKGQEMIDFCKEIGFELLPWQQWLAIQAHRYHPDTGRWAHPIVGLMIARQQGKSTFMALRILTGMMLWDEKLQLATAHKLTTSSEIFYKVLQIIEDNPKLTALFEKKFESKGSQEIRLNGARYLIRAGNSASRGIAAPSTIHIDEAREFDGESGQELWASMRYTQMSSPNPQAWLYSNAGHAQSELLIKMRERGLAAASGAPDNIGWFEWSAESGAAIDDIEAWRHSNPSLGYTVNIENIREALSDREDIFRTEVLCQFVDMINPVVLPSEFEKCKNEKVKLDPEKETWLAIDLSPDRKHAALVASQRLDKSKFMISLLQTWYNPTHLDDKLLANEIAPWVRKFPTNLVAYSSLTSASVASRLVPAGIPIHEINTPEYQQGCDEYLSAISSQRLVHAGQEELTKQVLAAVRLNRGDGGWVMGRKASGIICAAVAASMVSHFATRAETEIDIQVG